MQSNAMRRLSLRVHERDAAIVEQPHVDRGAAMLECVVDEIAHRALEELGVAWR